MRVADFSFDLPDSLIARYPVAARDQSRLMVLTRAAGAVTECSFSRIGEYFKAGDLLVVNDTRVIPARLNGRKLTGGRVEIFLVEPLADNQWRCLIKASKACQPGQLISLSEGVSAEVLSRGKDQDWLVCFSGTDDFAAWLAKNGQMPIPPYLGREAEELDRERYQTVYAGEPGAVAAPTAGLHFTPQLLDALKKNGVGLAHLTLHVGLGTFQPVRVERVQDHRIHCERYRISEQTAGQIAETKAAGGRVIAVGTTACRTLEYAAGADGLPKAGAGEADIFIYPGYSFKVVDALLTNFHLPESTLLMLVSAFAGYEQTMAAYQKAVSDRFRFYSYGDAMLIL